MKLFFVKIFQLIKVNFLKLRKLNASPHEISLGFAIGVWTNFLPIFGVHVIIAVFLTFIIKSNKLSAIIGSLLASIPIIFPFFWFLSWYFGSLIYSHFIKYFSFLQIQFFLNNFTKKYLEMLLGGIVLFPIVILIIYFPFKFLVIKWIRRKKNN